MHFKEIVYQEFKIMLHEKLHDLQQNLNDLSQSAANETKRTAGDKHETALAMLQIEQDNKRSQLNSLREQLQIFNKIDPTIRSSIIIKGSLVKTDKGYFFISTALGKRIINNQAVFALSGSSPLGKIMLGLKPTDKAQLKDVIYQIISIE